MAGNDKKNELTSGEAAAIYKDFVENARDLIQCVNSEGKLVFVNQAWLSTLGYAAEEIENITLWDIIHPDSMEHCMAVFEQVLTGRAFGEEEAIFVAKDGTPVMVEGNVGVKLDENGRFVHTRGIFRNVTERKQAEEALQESESKFRFLAENMTDIIWTADLALNYTYVSPSMEKISGGYSAEELLGTPGLNTLTPASLEKAAEVLGEEMTAEQTGHKDPNRVITMELEHINRDDGSLYWVENNMAFIRDEKGEATGIFAVTRDITERKRAEANLKKIEWMLSQKQTPASCDQGEDHDQGYGDLTDLNSDGIILKSIGPELLSSFSNDYLELLGTSSAIYEVNGDYAFGIFSSGWCRMMDCASRKLCNTSDNVEALNSGRWLCHESCWTDCSKEAILKREQVDIECNGGIRLYAVPIIASGEVVGAINFGYGDPPKDREKLQKLADTYHIYYDDLVREAHAYDTRPPYIVEMAKKRLHATARLIGSMVENKQAEEAINKSEARYREILSTIEEGYYEVDLAGNFVFFNDSFCKVLGYSRDELMQGSYKMLYKNPQEVFQTYNRVYRTGIAEKGADWPAITGNGQEIFIAVSITLRRDETGNPIGFRGIARDVSERKLVEEKLREHEKLQQLLMDLATDLINVPLEKVDEAINEMLKTVGEFTQVDRVYIFKHDYDRRVTSNTHEWCADGVPPEIDNLQDFPFERFTDFLEANQKGEIVNIPDVALMPANHAMCPIFEAQGIQSVIMLPLFSEDVNTGFVGFDAVKQKKSFTEQEIGLLKVLAEITSNVLTRQKTETNIRHISFHDQLTGLYNRHFLETEMARLNTKRQLPLAVIMADLNGLKLVNDTYGHETGDEMLKTAANIIRNSCREEDIISRFGGDEFVVLLPQTEIKEARLICKRIKEGCRDTFVEDVPVSIALGIATKTSETTSLIEALQEAENEMYRQKLTESRSTKSAVVTSLLNTLAEKSFETEEHTRGMKKIAQKIGAKLNLPDSELHRLDLLITLHDIGKINISEAILTKKSSLTDDEWEAIKKHPEIGYRIAMATEEFAHVAEDILAHHESWDGTGYPQGLKGSGISLLARIVAIADAYEVMSHGRPYKKAMSNNEIIAEFRRCSGAQFDPELVEIILSVLDADG